MRKNLRGAYQTFLDSLYEVKKDLEKTRRDVRKHELEYWDVVMNVKSVELRLGLAEKTDYNGAHLNVDEQLKDSMMAMGLPGSWAKVYSFLVRRRKPISAPDIVSALAIPRTETYHVLNKMIGDGFVDFFGRDQRVKVRNFSSQGNPTLYFAVHPLKAIGAYVGRRSSVLAEAANGFVQASAKYYSDLDRLGE